MSRFFALIAFLRREILQTGNSLELNVSPFQNRRLVTSRQRQEIYALNQLMTELERENFNRVCREKGYVMDD